jgi:low temperature requirement protein LtrA
MAASTPPLPLRHLRARGRAGPQQTTELELFFDLVYVFAVTQLSHLLLDDLSAAGAARAAFLLVVVWWAWVYTAWMTNWFDPASPAVRAILAGVMLASLLMAAALPGAFQGDGLLFAASYVALQVGRNLAATALLARDHRLRDTFERLVAWSVAAAALWLAGAALDGDQRLLLWVPALALELLAPVAGYWLPGRGRAATTDWDVEGGHFAERCQLFVLIALGESIVLAGATAAGAELTTSVVASLVVAFLETVALWWLYFGAPAAGSRTAVTETDDPGRVARDAYTYFHLLIVAGIIATAAGNELLIAHPLDHRHGMAAAIIVGGPALFLLGADLFQWRATGVVSAKRLLTAALIVLLSLLAPLVPALALAAIVTAILAALAAWELRARPAAEAIAAP